MKHNRQIHDRKTIRLKGYDYSQTGMYFITVCTANRECVLGEVIDNGVKLSGLGEIARNCWEEIPKHFRNAALDGYVIMPNHVHGVVIIKDAFVGTRHAVSPQERKDYRAEFGNPASGSLSTIVRSFKSAVTRSVHLAGFSEFAWQSRFYEHVIRDGADLDRIREYILENPMNWKVDEEYPGNIRMDPLHQGLNDWSALD